MLFSDETFSQICARSCDSLHDDEIFIPIQVALQSFCEDNPQIGNDFTTWYEKLIDDDELFRLDKVMENLVEDVSNVFDAKMANWISEGILDSNYDTHYALRGIIGLAIHTISGKIWCRELNDNMFFKKPIFGKYEIIALDYADNSTLNEFSNPHSYIILMWRLCLYMLWGNLMTTKRYVRLTKKYRTLSMKIPTDY